MLVHKGEIKIVLLIGGFGLLLVILIYLLMNRNKKIEINFKTIDLVQSDRSLNTIKLIWITNIGDLRFTKEDITKICDHNTIILLSGYSKKKLRKYNDKNIRILSSLAPVYYVWSDNDYSGSYRDLNALLLDCKVTILENTRASFETENGTKFSIIGLDDVETKRDDLEFALEELYDEGLNILASYTEVSDSHSRNYESIQVYLFERSQLNVNRNHKTIYLELNNKKRMLKQNTLTVLNFDVK